MLIKSRMNFEYTLLSKRKLQWFVDKNLVPGWHDPRFPTVRGIRRRGMTLHALKEYILMQGASKNTLLLTWDKIWAINKQTIDPVSPRHTAVEENHVVVEIIGGPAQPFTKEMPLHKKNADIGNKQTLFSNTLLLDKADVESLELGEELTLMDWGNAFVRALTPSVKLELHLEGDFKKTKKKLTWLAKSDKLVPLVLRDYDFLISKAKLEENDSFENFLIKDTEFSTKALGDANMSKLKIGDIIQLERKGK